MTIVAILAAVPSPPPEQIRRTADEVFARSEFAPDSGISNWMLKALGDFVRWLGNLSSVSPVLFWVFLIGCVSFLVLILAYGIYTAFDGFGFSRDAARRRQAAEAAAQRKRLSAELRANAARAAGLGDFTEAIRCLFLSLVYRFDENGRIGFHKSWTNREYLAVLDADPPVHSELAVFVDTLDDHWYGQRQAGRDRFDDCQARYDRLLTAV
jgi:hypothetical protein